MGAWRQDNFDFQPGRAQHGRAATPCARVAADPQNWITAYGNSGFGGTPPSADYGEEFAEAFATYVAQGRRFRAATLLNTVSRLPPPRPEKKDSFLTSRRRS